MVADAHTVLVIERSQVRDDLWRFGRAVDPYSSWGLIERNKAGGVEVVKAQGEALPWRDDTVTALCLVARRPDEPRLEYDLSWGPVEAPLYRVDLVARAAVPERHETLGQRAERLRRQ
jgi:hypothetical protein